MLGRGHPGIVLGACAFSERGWLLLDHSASGNGQVRLSMDAELGRKNVKCCDNVLARGTRGALPRIQLHAFLLKGTRGRAVSDGATASVKNTIHDPLPPHISSTLLVDRKPAAENPGQLLSDSKY